MKKLLLTGFLFALAGSVAAQQVIYLGTYRNGTGAKQDTVYFHGTFHDSLALKPSVPDSLLYYRELGTTFVDSARVAIVTDSLSAFDTNKWKRTGQFRRAFLAAPSTNANNKPGVYYLHVMAWDNDNNLDPNIAQSWDCYYNVEIAPWPGLVNNGSFENNLSNWTLTGTTTPTRHSYTDIATLPDGEIVLAMVGGAANPTATSDSFMLSVGQRFAYSGWMKEVNGDASGSGVGIGLFTASGTLVDSVALAPSLAGNWYGRSRAVTVGQAGNVATVNAGTYRLRLVFVNTSSVDSAYFDKIMANVESPHTKNDSIAFADSVSKNARIALGSDGGTPRQLAVDAQGEVDLDFNNATGTISGTEIALTQSEFTPDYAEQSEVANLDGWNPITDNDSLIVDFSSFAGIPLTVGTNNDKTGYALTPAQWSAAFDTLLSGDADNLIHDPGFETKPIGEVWHSVNGTNTIITTGTIKTGRKVLSLVGAASAAKVVSDTVRLFKGQRVFIGADVRLTAGDGLEIGIEDIAGGDSLVVANSYGSQWQRLPGYWKVGATGNYRMFLRGISTTSQGRMDNIFMFLAPDSATPPTRFQIASTNADTNWMSSFGARDDVVGSWGDSAQGWGQTGSSSGADSGVIARELKRKIAGLALNGTDTLTVGQRLFTSNNPCATCTFGTLYTDTVYTWNTSSSSTIPNVNVQVRNASGTVVGTFQTNASGKFTGTFDAGTYLLYPYFTSGIAWNTTDNPDTFVVTGNGQVDTIKGATISFPAPPTGGQITLGANIFDFLGDSIAGVTVEFTLNQPAYFSTDDTTNMSFVPNQARSRQTGVNGQWSIPLWPTTKLLGDDRRRGVYYTCKIYMPDGITTYQSSGQITISHTPTTQTFQYKNYGRWVTQ